LNYYFSFDQTGWKKSKSLLLDILHGMKIYNTETCECGLQMLRIYFSMTEEENLSNAFFADHLTALKPLPCQIKFSLLTTLGLKHENGIYVVTMTERKVKTNNLLNSNVSLKRKKNLKKIFFAKPL